MPSVMTPSFLVTAQLPLFVQQPAAFAILGDDLTLDATRSITTKQE